ncbi:serine/threonine protein kinase [Candidatus Uabimicrobium amorphum]|uniref:non-specific serine/threonine protein kinase n=1 Tax=Uabimicrobium amorphum TaxID=2596890 RepID=A0A5S9IJ24_UABAM|nr:serine/threonine-protein kinase [Candidatus Uabimicrobium amorphum]BBM82301.1 protein kinase [Candidatus Uabimicrobium amorphum]
MVDFHPQKVGSVFHLQPGQEIDGYTILSEVSRGGMGIVFKAEEKNSQRIVAIKIIFQNQSKIAKRRFLREAELAAKLQHKSIVEVYNAGTLEGNLYLVMEYVEGVTLEDWSENRDCSMEDAVGIVSQIADALEYAHRKKVVHRDVKPSNIMIQRDGTAKIMDFGLAKSVHIGDYSLTKTGDIIGTPSYMAPELLKPSRSREINYQADIYSLGTILYELLSGQQMIPGRSAMEIIFNLERAEIVPLRNYIPELSDELEIIQKKAVATKAQRYETMQLFAHDLHCFKEGKKVGTKLPFAWNKLYFPVAVFSALLLLFVVYRVVFSSQSVEVVNVDNTYFEGAVAFENKQYQKAFGLFKSIDKKRPILLFYLGASLYEHEKNKRKITGKAYDIKRILQYLQGAYTKIPQHLETNYYLAQLHGENKNSSQAKQHLQNCIEIAPNDPRYYIDFAKICYTNTLEDPGEALPCFENLKKALNLDPGNLEAADLLFRLSLRAPHFQGYNWMILEEMFFSLESIKRPLLFRPYAQKTKVETYPKYIEGLVRLDERSDDFYLYLASVAYIENKPINSSQATEGMNSFSKVLADRERDAFVRFLAARSLGDLGKFELLASHFDKMDGDTVGKIVVSNILSQHQISIDMDKVLSGFKEIMLRKEQEHSLLMSLVGQSCYIYHTKYVSPVNAKNNVETMLFKLMASNIPDNARLAAAASAFSFAAVNNDLGRKGYRTLKKFLQDKNPTRRHYAHSYLWNNSKFIKDKDEFVNLYKSGLNDNDENVNMICLSFFDKYIKKASINRIALDLKRLGLSQKSQELTLRALCLWNISLQPVEAIISILEENPQMSPLTQCMIVRYFSICEYMKKNRPGSFPPGLMKLLAYTARSQNHFFQANMYFLMALFVPQLVMDGTRKHPDTQAGLINGLGYSMGLSRQGQFLKDNLARYLYEPQPTIRQAANTMMVMILNDNERAQFCNSLQNNQDAFVLAGASDGFHRIMQLRLSLMDLKDPVKMQMKMMRVVNPQRYRPYTFEKKYDKYEVALRTRSRSTESYLQKMYQAKKLYERPVYLYEEALLLMASNRDAKPSLRRAIDLVPDFYRARVTLAGILQKEGRGKEAFLLVENIVAKIDNPYTLQKIAQLFKKLRKYSHAEIAYKKLWDLDPYKKERFLDIVRIFCLQKKRQEALRYVSWGVKMFKRKYATTASYDDIIAQSDFAEDEFKLIYKSSQIQRLPE